LVRLLRSNLLLPSIDEPLEVIVFTQVGIPGAGIIDLVIDMRYPDVTREIWVELKVMAGESGRQLDNYGDHIRSLPDEHRPTLVTVARRPVRASSVIP